MPEEKAVKETPKPKKKAKASVEAEKVMAETQAVGAKTESMKTMTDVYPGRSFKMKTMADRNRL